MLLRVQALKFIKLWKERARITPNMPQGMLITQRDVVFFLRNALPAALKLQAPPQAATDCDPDEWAEAATGALLEFVKALEEGRATIVQWEPKDNT
jgi:hypothetical protein